jgi:hypothetical protein
MTIDVVLGPDPGLSPRALASRTNGARSRGPKSAAGKARSARNALKHGLCAKKLLISRRPHKVRRFLVRSATSVAIPTWITVASASVMSPTSSGRLLRMIPGVRNRS